MNIFRIRFVLMILLTGIWCVLNGRFNLTTILGGIVVSIVTYYILKLIQPESGKVFSYNISIFRLIYFIGLVLVAIYSSAFLAIKHILRNEINPQFVATNTKIKNPWLQSLIGNAITLTPGTVTVHMADGHYTVLWLYPKTIRHKDIKKHLIQDFEDALIKEDQHA